ncbi:MAG TPA: hypothetical protein VM101_01700 [Flavitalea sp.]|nr:hypothetical protein [Flavitalea sp.]
MKRIALTLAVFVMLAFTSCSDSTSNDKSDTQVKDPVMNSGPQTEGERAQDAVKDSAHAGSDSTIHRDADAPSTPH